MPKSDWNIDKIPDLSGRVIIVTGSTSGIGEQAARVIASKNATTIIAARNMAKAEKASKKIVDEFPEANIQIRELDLTSLQSIKNFSDAIKKDFDRLDVLINNAGIMMCPFAKTEDGFEIQMGTNHLGHFALTGHLMSLLKKTANSRIVVLSSMVHRAGNIDLDDINWEKRSYNTRGAYADSKLANLYFEYELVRKLQAEDNNPIVTAAHPGWTRTNLQVHSKIFTFLNPLFSQTADQGALPTLRAAFDEDVQPGDYFGPSKFFEMHGAPMKVTSSKKSHDEKAAKKLWQLSEQMTGVSF